jgi:hypothetical protein
MHFDFDEVHMYPSVLSRSLDGSSNCTFQFIASHVQYRQEIQEQSHFRYQTVDGTFSMSEKMVRELYLKLHEYFNVNQPKTKVVKQGEYYRETNNGI